MSYMIPTTEMWRRESYKNKDTLNGKLIYGTYGTDWVINSDHKKHETYVFGRVKEVKTSSYFSTDPWVTFDHPSGVVPIISGVILDNGIRIGFGYGHITEKLRVEI